MKTETKTIFIISLLINAKLCHGKIAQADGSLTQTDDIHSVKLIGISWLIHVSYAAKELAMLHLNACLAFTRALCRVPLKPSTFPAQPAFDIVRIIFRMFLFSSWWIKKRIHPTLKHEQTTNLQCALIINIMLLWIGLDANIVVVMLIFIVIVICVTRF